MRDVVKPGRDYFGGMDAHALLTFDDGYVNFYDHALPVLTEEHCPATLFALAGKFGGTNDWDQGDLPEEERDPLLTLAQLEELAGSDLVTIGSHGLMHRNLSAIAPKLIGDEIHDSYSIFSSTLGDAFAPVFAYPWGEYSETALNCMSYSQYRLAFTTQPSQWSGKNSPYEVPRYTIFWHDTEPLRLTAKLLRRRVGL
jgi:peptidoglycan/xylan/chitin deacetylase (PgdA/CDA1 family)